jgi:hypothetical protein
MKRRILTIGWLGLGLLLLTSVYCSGRLCADQTFFGQDTVRIVLAEQSSERNYKTYSDYREIIAVVLYIVGGSCMLISYGLFIIRHLRLRQYGCPTGLDGYFVPGLDAKMLREISKTEESEKLRTFYKWINILIPTLFIGGIFIIILALTIR